MEEGENEELIIKKMKISQKWKWWIMMQRTGKEKIFVEKEDNYKMKNEEEIMKEKMREKWRAWSERGGGKQKLQFEKRKKDKEKKKKTKLGKKKRKRWSRNTIVIVEALEKEDKKEGIKKSSDKKKH